LAALLLLGSTLLVSACTDPKLTVCFLIGGTLDQYTFECIPPRATSAAASAGEVLYLAAAAHVGGALGTDWRSDVELHNLGDEAAAVTIWLLVHGADNASPRSTQVTIEAGHSVRLADVLSGQFGTGGSAALMLSVGSGRVLATSRTYNLLASGNPLGLPGGSTFGQYIPAVERTAAIDFGEEGRLIQLSHSTAASGGFRTNIGLVNITSASLDVEVELYTAGGALLGTVPVTLPPFGYQQLNRVFSLVTGGSVDDGYAVVRTTTELGRFLAYASVVDNLTGDPIAITAAELPTDEPPGPGAAAYVVAAAHLGGIGGTNWRTDAEIHNWGGSTAAFTIELLEHGVDNSSPSYAKSYTLAAGHSLRLGDILASEFGFSGAAALRITTTSGHVLVTSRTYNLLAAGNSAGLPAGATFGQYIPGVTVEEAIQEGEEGRLIQLSHTPGGATGFRTNLVLVNAVAAQIEVEVALYRSDGTLLGTTTRTLAPYEYRQLNGVFELVTGSTVADGYAVVRTTTTGGAVFALASVVDNLTGDPVGLGAAVVLSAAAEGLVHDAEGTMGVLGQSNIESAYDGLEAAGVDGVLDAVVSGMPGLATRTAGGVEIDYGAGTTAPDGSVRSGSMTVDASDLAVSNDRITGVVTISHDSLLIDGVAPLVGPTTWSADFTRMDGGRVVGELQVSPAGASVSTTTTSRGDLFGRLAFDTLVCPSYPIGGSLTLDVGGETVIIRFDDRCDGGFDRSTGGPVVEPEGDVLALQWSFTGDTSPVGTIDSTTGVWQTIGSSGFPRLNALARSPSGVYYSVTEYDTCGASRLITIDPRTGAGSVVAGIDGIPDNNYVSGLAFSPGGVLYAALGDCHVLEPSDWLYTINPASGTASLVGAIAGYSGVGALDFDDSTGTLYGWDNQAGLITIDPASGTATDVNPSVGGPNILSLVILPNGSMVGGRSELYSIDRTTGETTRIGSGSFDNVRGIEVLDGQ